MKFLLLFTLLSNFILSVNLNPMIQTVTSKKDKNILFRVSNPTAEPVAVDFALFKVLDTENNQENRVKTDEVQAYPTQFILNPNETKSVRVRYMQKKLPQLENIYRIVVKELDIDVSDKNEQQENTQTVSAKLKVRYSYEGLLFVHHKDSVENISILNIEKSVNSINVTFKNNGQISAIPYTNIYNYFAVLKNGEKQLLITKDFEGVDFRRVLAGKTRSVLIKNIHSIPIDKIENIKIKKR